MGIPINGGDPVHWVAHPGRPPHAIVTRAMADYHERAGVIREKLAQLREAMDLPEFDRFLLKHKGNKVDNLEMIFRMGSDTRKVFDQIDAVKGSHGIKFRKKTEAYARFQAIMGGCPKSENWGNSLLGMVCAAIGMDADQHAWGSPAVLEHPDGRMVLSIGLSMDMNGWDKKLDAAGFLRITKAEYLRLQADVEEAKSSPAPAAVR